MDKIDKLVDEFLKVFYNETYSSRFFGKIYRNTNEHLSKILTNYNFLNKSVLSVLASSDQVFSSYYLGANSVDSFDSNIFTYFYFFLKKWNLMKYEKNYISADNSLLINCLELHNNTYEELIAYEFWRKVFERISYSLYYSNIFYKDVIDRSLPYEKDEGKLKTIIYDKSPNFNNLDLFSEINLNKKYQIIILSNILEYMYEIIYEHDDSNISKIVCNNLDKLLADDGIIICSNILISEYISNPIFESIFTYEEGPLDYFKFFKKEVPSCYIYKRKQH